MLVMVTGGTGFIGSHVVDLLLANGHTVRLLSRSPALPERWKDKSVTLLPGNLRRPETVADAMTGAEAVFHIGEIKNKSLARSKENVDLVGTMAAKAKDAGVRRLVFISSLSVAGIPATTPADETTEPAVGLTDQYTAYKRSAEERIRNAGTEYLILRPGIVYGPGSRYLGSLLRMVKLAGPLGIPFIGSGRNAAPFIHVADLARAVYLAGVKPDAKNETLNLTDGLAHSWRDFFTAIGRAYNRPVRLIPLPPFLFRVPAVFADLLGGVLGVAPDAKDYIDYLSRDVHFTNRSARTALGWEPEKTDLDQAVAETVAWYDKKA